MGSEHCLAVSRGDLAGRGKFPYLFAARGNLGASHPNCTNYIFLLLAWQYTATGGMHQTKAPHKWCFYARRLICKFAHLIQRKGFAYLAAKRSRYCGSAEMFVKGLYIKWVMQYALTRAPHSRTCLPLGIILVHHTLIVLIVSFCSSLGNIPLRGMHQRLIRRSRVPSRTPPSPTGEGCFI